MLKTIRKITGTIFFIFSLSVFLGYVSDRGAVSFFNSFNLFPALSEFTSHGFDPVFVITIIVAASCLFVGRFYCSYLCPMGFLQDLASIFGRLFFGIKKRRAAVYKYFRIFIAALCVSSVLSESTVWGWFDHFSNFGRIVNDFFRPAVYLAASPFASYLNRTSYFQIPEIEFSFSFDFCYGIFIFILLVISSLFVPRWFCATLCPSGAIFSWLFKYGFAGLAKSGKCPSCQKCENACPVDCVTDGVVDYDLCVTCLECTGACPYGSLRLKFSMPAEKSIEAAAPLPAGASENTVLHNSRRDFLKTTCAAAAGLAMPGIAAKSFASLPAVPATILPPGAINMDRFFSDCSACHLCVSACPTGVIAVSGLENGLAGLSKPRMDYAKSYCSYECNRCMQICPSGALKRHSLQQKQLIKIGRVKLDTSSSTSCIPYKDKKDCGACSEHCPTGAVHMVRKGDIFVPELSWEYCIGCGICEHACPVKSGDRPIVVYPVAEQSVAKSPKRLSKPIENKPGSGDFPF